MTLRMLAGIRVSLVLMLAATSFQAQTVPQGAHAPSQLGEQSEPPPPGTLHVPAAQDWIVRQPSAAHASPGSLSPSTIACIEKPCAVEQKNPWRSRWWASVVLLAAANVADLHSSRGLYETNPLLRGPNGRFRLSRGAVVKSAATGGFVLLQFLLFRKMPDSGLEKPFTITNGAAAGAVAATAVRNYKIR